MKAGFFSFRMGLWVVVALLSGATEVAGASPTGGLTPQTASHLEESVEASLTPLQEEETHSAFPSLPGETGASDAALQPTTAIPHLTELDRPATTVDAWFAQIEASLVRIVGVQVEATDAGLQVVLETENGALDVPQTRAVGNALIADITGATIAEDFSQAEPIAGIALVSVTQLPGDRVRVAITGTDAPPVAEVTSEEQGLVLGVAMRSSSPSGVIGQAGTEAEDEAIQIVATGEEGYNPSSATTATRTDTPLRDIPQSIQVVPRQVLEDRNPGTVIEAVETVAGVVNGSNNFGAPGGTNIIRGFASFDSGNLRNGFRDYDYYSVTSLETIERIEVLRGPASVLFGAQEPGGVINVITRQPLDEPYYNVEFEAGSYEFYQPTIDLSGPITDDGDVLYRFIASYQGAGSYIDFLNSSTTTIAPSMTFRFGDRTNLNLSYEYARYFEDNPPFEVPLLSDGSFPPRNFYSGYPDLTFHEITTNRIGVALNHRFSDNWQLRNNFAIVFNDRTLDRNLLETLTDDRILSGIAQESSSWANNYFGQIDLVGRFNTGSISHQLVAGFDINFFETVYQDVSAPLPNLDIFNPNYDISRPEFSNPREFYNLTQSYGVYLQDQIAFSDSLSLLIGGRYDWASTRTAVDGEFQNDGAFSPRIGLVYQPSDSVSLYASYSSSFKPSIGSNPDGEAFEPTRGTQYEIGTRVDFLEGGLSANLAAYYLTRTNILTPDPDDPSFSIQTGEARSQGIELDVTGEILPGWNIVLSYAYTDAEVTEDNVTPVGNQLDNVPFNQASLWTTYEIQEGDLEGLGVGLGLFYIGERQGDLANSFELPSYLRTDAALYYRRGRLNAAINVRNLLDIDYANYSFGRNIIQRAAPLTIIGSISWTF